MKLSEKRVDHLTRDADSILAFTKGDAGSKWGVLERLADTVLSGGAVHPAIHRITNAVIAETILMGALPSKRTGRPKSDPFNGHEVAYMYLELTDAGTGREDALVAVNKKFGLDGRHIDRLVKRYRPMIGWFVEDRDRYRTWRQVCEETGHQDYEASVRIDLDIQDRLPVVNTKPSTEQLLVDARRLLGALRVEEAFDIKSAQVVVSDITPP